jgi:hypothetical protein
LELYRTPATPPPNPPQGMTWQETENAAGWRVDFSGARSSRAAGMIALLFLVSGVGMMLFMLFAVKGATFVLFTPFVAFGLFAVMKTWPHSSRGRLVVADGRISFGLRSAIDVASIREIACVDVEREYSVNDVPRTVRWFDAVARTERGERVLASFAERECATFFCERVCVLAKVPRT